jgi:hypothetical protein
MREIARITAPAGVYVTEFANKRNLKAIVRYMLGRGKPGESPFSLEPYEFVSLNIDYHPRHICAVLEKMGFVVENELGASFFRLPWLKRLAPASLLARLDALLQERAAPARLTPSIFLRSSLSGEPQAIPG